MEDEADRGLTRRQALGRGLAGATALSSAGLLAACGGSSSSKASSSSSAASSGTPKRGGTLNIAVVSDGTATTLNPGVPGPGDVGDLENILMYDTLFLRGTSDQPIPGLCTSAEPSQDFKLWTLTVRDGVTWHDGKPFTADDVVYMFQNVWASKLSTNNAFDIFVDTTNVRKRGPLHVEVPLHIPISQFPTMLISNAASVVRRGSTNFSKYVVGTGPFKLQSFSDSQAVFVANRNYWEHGKPYVDKVVVNSSFKDETAMLNALLSGAVDIVYSLPFDLAKPSSQYQLLHSHGPTFVAFCMRCDSGPFADVRVRQAMRLAIQRKSMVEDVLLGYGRVGYDLAAPQDPYFAAGLTRTPDIEEAKSLLRQAGRSNLTVTLDTGAAGPGFVGSATLLKEQAAEAGITIQLNQIPSAGYYTPAAGYGTHPFRQTQWTTEVASLTEFWVVSSLTTAPYGLETHWATPESDKILLAAVAAAPGEQAKQRWYDFQKLYFDTGGYILWNTTDYVDALANNVKGLTPSQGGYLSAGRVQDAWLA